MPRDRIDLFTSRLRDLCAEAGVPAFDRTDYDARRDTLYFVWDDPEFCLGAHLGHASINGLTPQMLRGAWDAKFGATPAASD